MDFSGATSTLSRCSRHPTRISAMPNLNAGLPRSIIAVGCALAILPRTASADTNTLGAQSRTGSVMIGFAPRQVNDRCGQHALAFDGDEGRRLRKRHPHL